MKNKIPSMKSIKYIIRILLSLSTNAPAKGLIMSLVIIGAALTTAKNNAPTFPYVSCGNNVNIYTPAAKLYKDVPIEDTRDP